MSSRNLGRLQKVDLREAWTSQAVDFTPWLFQAESLKLVEDSHTVVSSRAALLPKLLSGELGVQAAKKRRRRTYE